MWHHQPGHTKSLSESSGTQWAQKSLTLAPARAPAARRNVLRSLSGAPLTAAQWLAELNMPERQ
eukprot:1067250-Pyramimonas_sp.AAC.1